MWRLWYDNIQVPLLFFKVIAWPNGAGKEKTAAFLLSQSDLVKGITFQQLHFD